MKRLRIHVFGRVQGVFFRASTQTIAHDLGITGWVHNEADGSVRIEAEGDEKELSQFLEWCHHGPAHAVVDSVQTEHIELTKGVDFEIR